MEPRLVVERVVAHLVAGGGDGGEVVLVALVLDVAADEEEGDGEAEPAQQVEGARHEARGT